MKREIRDYLKDILNAIDEIKEFLSGLLAFEQKPAEQKPACPVL